MIVFIIETFYIMNTYEFNRDSLGYISFNKNPKVIRYIKSFSNEYDHTDLLLLSAHYLVKHKK